MRQCTVCHRKDKRRQDGNVEVNCQVRVDATAANSAEGLYKRVIRLAYQVIRITYNINRHNLGISRTNQCTTKRIKSAISDKERPVGGQTYLVNSIARQYNRVIRLQLRHTLVVIHNLYG